MGSDCFFEGKIAWLYTVDSALEEEVVQQIITNLNANEDTSAPCMPCLRGTYGILNGQVSINSCVNCEAGKSTIVTGGNSSAICEACTVKTYGAGTGHQCVNCEAGTYNALSGRTACAACPTHSSSLPGSTVLCACMCGAGYTGQDGGTCTQCIAGKYKVATGDAVCTNCDIRQYSTAVAATLDVCQECPSNSNAPDASDEPTDCTCNSGSGGPNGDTCTECMAGKYKVSTGEEVCTSCVTEYYSTAVGAKSNVCQRCPSKSNSFEASDKQTDCTCNSGSTGPDGSTCEECIAGKYKILTGDAECTNCVAGKYSTQVGAVSDVCQMCLENSISPTGSTNATACVCDAGFTRPNGRPCAACPAGTYKTTTGSVLWSGQYSDTVAANVSTICKDCPML